MNPRSGALRNDSDAVDLHNLEVLLFRLCFLFFLLSKEKSNLKNILLITVDIFHKY